MASDSASNNKSQEHPMTALDVDKHHVATAPSPPQPKARQWLQITSTFIVFFNTWGFLLTSGVFQTYYEKVLISEYSSSSIAWISTTCAFIILSAGVITGPLYDNGFYRAILLFGSLLQVVGVMLLSLCTQYYQLFLCHAICIGLGAGIVFTPSVAAATACLPVPAVRAKAMGLMACGSSIGGIVYPIMFQFLIPLIGFLWTVRSIGFVIFELYLISYSVLVGYQEKKSVRRAFDRTALMDWPFMTLCVASLLSAIAFYIPLLYLPLFTEIRIPNLDPNLSLDLLPILNGASVVGRLFAGFAAAIIGPTETITIALTFGTILLFSWIAVDTVAGTIVWSVFWGMISGILVSLPGAFIPLFCPSLSVLGTRSGMYWIWIGLGILIGSPIAGAIYDFKFTDNDWRRLETFAGIFMFGAALLNLYPVSHLRRKQRETSS
ncbi:putative MFS monocarboxylate transporter [Astrocystis sublimbata]|nr:putative MFS monocarboxylate transporter [Astrocystis sublimbata]